MLLSGVRGEANAKRLASQFIARFFKNFPAAADSALDALFDLCEDEDVNVSITIRNIQNCETSIN